MQLEIAALRHQLAAFQLKGQRPHTGPGTSMASPNALNLAGKLFALDPDLTPADVIELMTRGRNSPCRR